MSKRTVNVRELCFLALMAAVLFVQETLLSSLPNIQLTVMLLMVYAATVGISKAALVMTVHVLLDNLLWGSMSPTNLFPMWFGWFSVLVIGFLLRNRSLGWLVSGAVLGSVLYILIYAVVQCRVFRLDLATYLVTGLLFEILLCCSSAITVAFLYQPAEKLLKRFYSRAVGSCK